MSEIYELEEQLEFLEEHGQPEEEAKSFRIDDDIKADWALKKIAADRKECERVKAIALKEIEVLEEKIKHLEETTERKTTFLKGCLAQYFETVPHKATKTQETYKLLSGSLVFKLPSQKMVKDDEKLLEYFKQNNMNEYIKTKETPAWAEFKKNLSIVDDKVIDTSTGEVVEVVKVEETEGLFDVKTS